ncbi:MAG: methyl-accepting chemotaxis protein [Acidobacteria bacterium]|nr:methyl-accepting chemotaxis protein [Acidobacteriota bacterium]
MFKALTKNIQGKITSLFTGFILVVAILGAILSYTNLKSRLYKEFIERVHGEASSFNEVIALDLMVGDTEALEVKMKSYLAANDLVAISVSPMESDGTPGESFEKQDTEELKFEWAKDELIQLVENQKIDKGNSHTEGLEVTTFLKTVDSTKTASPIVTQSFKHKGNEFIAIGLRDFEEGKATDRLIMVFSLKRIDGILSAAKTTMYVSLFVLILISIMVAAFLARYIVNPINEMTVMIQDIAEGEGDLTKSLDDKRSDELGTMAGWFNKFLSHLKSLIREIDENSQSVDSSAKDMSSLSTEFVTQSERTRDLSNSVAESSENANLTITAMASAAEEISATIGSVSQGAQAMSEKMTSVMETIEGLSHSIKNVANNAASAKNTAEEATELSANSAQSMSGLGISANEIGRVTEVIKRIAEQTNLLALNASIEAASAGEAGKGFSVVANEIKNLAQQSAVAAEEINQKIRGIQAKTSEAIQFNSKIVDIINNINRSVTEISAMVSEQNSATEKMSHTVRDAAEKAQSMAEAIAEVANGSNGVSISAAEAADVIGRINRAAQEVRDSANKNEASARKTKVSSEKLGEISVELANLVSRFKL